MEMARFVGPGWSVYAIRVDERRNTVAGIDETLALA